MADVLLPIIRRKLFTIVSAVSLVLLSGTVALWMRSHRTYEQWNRYSGGAITFQFANQTGRCTLFWGSATEVQPPPDGWYRYSFLPTQRPSYKPEGSIDRLETVNPEFAYSVHGWSISFTHTLACILFAIAPTMKLIALRFRRRRTQLDRRDLCPHCGYDLRASPERCPECGAAVA